MFWMLLMVVNVVSASLHVSAENWGWATFSAGMVLFCGIMGMLED